MDDAGQSYFYRVFIFFGQGDYRRTDQIIRIDVVLSREVVEYLLESSMVVIMLKIPILVRNELKYYESLSFYWFGKENSECDELLLK
jgi:hypothetical protein